MEDNMERFSSENTLETPFRIMEDKMERFSSEKDTLEDSF
jgi:hypothetical protein